MQISLTKLQGYNVMYKLLDDYYKKTKSEDILGLLPGMLFLVDGGTLDSAIWEDWIEAIGDKKMLTKQEAFHGMIRFLEAYHCLTTYAYAKSLADEMRLAKDCNDISVSIVKQWNLFLKEVLREPEGSREYLKLTKE